MNTKTSILISGFAAGMGTLLGGWVMPSARPPAEISRILERTPSAALARDWERVGRSLTSAMVREVRRAKEGERNKKDRD